MNRLSTRVLAVLALIVSLTGCLETPKDALSVPGADRQGPAAGLDENGVPTVVVRNEPSPNPVVSPPAGGGPSSQRASFNARRAFRPSQPKTRPVETYQGFGSD